MDEQTLTVILLAALLVVAIPDTTAALGFGVGALLIPLASKGH